MTSILLRWLLLRSGKSLPSSPASFCPALPCTCSEAQTLRALEDREIQSNLSKCYLLNVSLAWLYLWSSSSACPPAYVSHASTATMVARSYAKSHSPLHVSEPFEKNERLPSHQMPWTKYTNKHVEQTGQTSRVYAGLRPQSHTSRWFYGCPTLKLLKDTNDRADYLRYLLEPSYFLCELAFQW